MGIENMELSMQSLIDIMSESLINNEKKKLLPHNWQNKYFDVSELSNTKSLINYFAHWIYCEMEHREFVESRKEKHREGK